MRTIRNFISIIDYQTIVVTLLAGGSTFACQYFDLVADVPTGLIGLAVVFPIVFSINAAYKRREQALGYFGALKAHAVALYYAHRDWVPGVEGKDSEQTGRAREIIEKLLNAIRDDLHAKAGDESLFGKVYATFSDLSTSVEKLRDSKVTNSEISRANQYISKMMIDYERMRNIATYRTPVSLRAYSSVFLNFFPVVFGPYFAYLSEKFDSFPGVGYGVAVLYALVLVSLDNIQEDLENPYDAVGTDDIKLEVADYYRPVIGG